MSFSHQVNVIKTKYINDIFRQVDVTSMSYCIDELTSVKFMCTDVRCYKYVVD